MGITHPIQIHSLISNPNHDIRSTADQTEVQTVQGHKNHTADQNLKKKVKTKVQTIHHQVMILQKMSLLKETLKLKTKVEMIHPQMKKVKPLKENQVLRVHQDRVQDKVLKVILPTSEEQCENIKLYNNCDNKNSF